MIQLQWLGHSCFRGEYQGSAVILDPFQPGSVPGCRDIHQSAAQVLCSHEHYDHAYRDGVVLTGIPSPFQVTAIESFHDDCQGAKRGPNLIHILAAGGIRVAHMGDIGCMPSPQALEQLQGLDAMLIPVGGFYTVGPQEAKAIVDAARPRMVIPMHYRSASFGFDVLATVDEFLALFSHVRRVKGDTVQIFPSSDPFNEVETVLLAYAG